MSAADPVTELRGALLGAAATLRPGDSESGSGAAGLRLERPKREGQGDYATNAAMLLAPVLGRSPREISERLGTALAERLGERLVRFEVAGPGFLNLVLSDAWYRDGVRAVLAAGDAFAAGGAAKPERILIEFVSANPTGPLVAASGRHAAYGDALARILEHHGHAVAREYYFNDAGAQIRRLGESVRARARGEEIPEDGYHGEYVAELARAVPGAADENVDVDAVAAEAVAMLLEQIKATLERYGVHFDRYFSERALHEGSPSELDQALRLLDDSGNVYQSEGATWLRTTTFGDDKDRVLRRGTGEPTYFAADVAYMLDKRTRGWERQLLPVGADHHGYTARLKAAFAALGGDPELLEPLIIQFVHLVEGGQVFAMSKRRGEFVTLDDLLDEIGVDATRFFMLQRSHDRTLELDVALARSQSQDNPVYYVQYAHARICSMLGRLGDDRVQDALTAGGAQAPAASPGTAQPATPAEATEADLALHPSERELIRKLLSLPEEITEAAERRAPHRIASYALELAQAFTAFYRDCRVVGATPLEVESFRIAVCVASRQVLALVLALLGVSAPDSM